MPSLIISNVFTKMGEQTFTLRWEHGENINWCKIYDFIYKKSGVHPKYHKIQIERNYIKYEKINNYPAFNLNDFGFSMLTNRDIYAHNTTSDLSAGGQILLSNSYPNAGDLTVELSDSVNDGRWSVSSDSILTFPNSPKCFMGFYTGVNEYKIIKLNYDTLWLEYRQNGSNSTYNDNNKWYAKFISID